MKQLVSIRGYVIPDASMIITRSMWTTLWTQPATWDEFKALRRGIARMESWARRLAAGSFEGIARVELVGVTGLACCSVYAPGRELAGSVTDPGAIWNPRDFQAGDEITDGRGEIIERIIRSGGSPPSWDLRSLYLPAIAVLHTTVYDLTPYRLATPEDHDRAKAYAAKFDTGEDQKASSAAGGEPASRSGSRTTRGARSQPGKLSSSQSSAAATRDTQSGSDEAHKSHDLPSHSTSITPSALSSSSTTAASESRKPRPKKRRMPRDHVS